MAQLDDLTAALTNDETGLAALAADANALVALLKSGNPDLTAAIAAATALGQGISDTDAAVKAALPPA